MATDQLLSRQPFSPCHIKKLNSKPSQQGVFKTSNTVFKKLLTKHRSVNILNNITIFQGFLFVSCDWFILLKIRCGILNTFSDHSFAAFLKIYFAFNISIVSTTTVQN